MKLGLWKALNKTAKITRIVKFRKAVNENRQTNKNGSWRPSTKLQTLRKYENREKK